MISHPRRKRQQNTTTYLPPFEARGRDVIDRLGLFVVQFLPGEQIKTHLGIIPAADAIAAALNTFCNSSSLAAGAMENPETESLKAVHSRTGEYVGRAGDLEKRLKPHAAPCRIPPSAPGTCSPAGGKADGENRGGDVGRRGATDRETPRKRCGEKPSGCGLARGHGEPLGHGAICFDCARAIGLTPKGKAVGVWQDECCVCHKQKPCTDRWHDSNQPKES